MEISPSPVLDVGGRVFGDTSYFFALLNAKDPDHAAAMRIAQQIAIGQVEVFTTWDVVAETATLLRYRWTHGAAAEFLTRLVPDLTVLQPDEDDRIAAIRLFLRKRDLKLSVCDALSYVVVSTRLEWAPCLSFDADFRAMGSSALARNDHSLLAKNDPPPRRYGGAFATGQEDALPLGSPGEDNWLGKNERVTEKRNTAAGLLISCPRANAGKSCSSCGSI